MNRNSNTNNLKPKRITSILLIASSMIMIILGVMNEQTASVMTKAINICLECIGIG